MELSEAYFGTLGEGPSIRERLLSQMELSDQRAAEQPLWPVDETHKLKSFSFRLFALNFRQALRTYVVRWQGQGVKHPPRVSLYRAFLAFIGPFLSMLLIGGMQQWINPHWPLPLLLSTFGPGAALVFGLPGLPSSQPINCFGGTTLCGIIAIFFRVFVGRQSWLAMSAAVGVGVPAMVLTSLSYPPGLATAILITTLVPEDNFQQLIVRSSTSWCVRPILEHSLLLRFTSGCRILLAATLGNTAILLVALIVNNLDQEKGYPTRWL